MRERVVGNHDLSDLDAKRRRRRKEEEDECRKVRPQHACFRACDDQTKLYSHQGLAMKN